MLADLCPCFHRSPTKLCPGIVSFACWIVTEFWSFTHSHSCSKLCPVLCRLRTKLCPNFGCSRTRLCPISLAPCPFPNLAGTLISRSHVIRPLSPVICRQSRSCLASLVSPVSCHTSLIYHRSSVAIVPSVAAVPPPPRRPPADPAAPCNLCPTSSSVRSPSTTRCRRRTWL